jgi:hypothetical protein
MSANYISPIDEKMMAYSHRLRDLILEAHAEGIVFSIGAEDNGALAPLEKNQRHHRVVVAVPKLEHEHPQLYTPYSITAEAVVETTQAIVPAKKIEAYKPRPLVPLYTELSSGLFVNRTLICPWRVGDDHVETSALKFDRAMDLLALSNSDAWFKSGKVRQNDMIGETVTLAEIFYIKPNSQVDSFKVWEMPGALFPPATSGDYKDLTVDFTFSLPLDLGTIRVAGRLNRLHGRLHLTAKASRPDVTPLGFTLKADRIQPK